MKTVYVENIYWYGTSSYPYYLNLKNAKVYKVDDVLSKFGFKSQKEIEESDDFVRLFYVDYNELVRDFIKLYDDDELTEISKTWIDEDRFGIEFRCYIDGVTPLEYDWYAYRYDRLREAAVKWCEENKVKYSKKKWKWDDKR